MRHNSKSIKWILAAALTIATLLAGQTAFANTWSVSRSNGKFVITRASSGSAEMVKYRTVSVSALAGKHFTGVSGTVTFAAGETSKEVSVTETALASVPLQYRYQGTNKLYYDFQVLDLGGVLLADYRKEIYTGGEMNNQYYLNGYGDYVMNDMPIKFLYLNKGSLADFFSTNSNFYHDVSYTPPTSDVQATGDYAGYVLIDDSYDYSKKSATVSPDFFFAMNRAGANGEWHKLVGNKLLATVCFTEKEKDDGYAYVQILIGDGSTAYDTGADPNGSVNTPVKSIYKACFELKEGGGTYDGAGKWIFPHSYDCHNQSEELSQYSQNNDQSAFYMSSSYLWEQKFRSEDYRASGFNNAFWLDPDIGNLTVRFDCGGSNDDTYGYKDLFVRYGLVDQQAPTVLKDQITVNPGLHGTGNKVTVSIPFSEPLDVYFRTRYILHTTWGDLVADHDCDGTNVLSFSGNITADTGTKLTINSMETTYEPGNSSSDIKPISDRVYHAFAGDVSKTLNVTVDGIYSISYNLKGGSLNGCNPGKYSNSGGAITLINPTKDNYVFAGWTGTDLDAATMTVTIPAGSTGDRSYTATWAPDVNSHWTGNGTEASPYIITTAQGLVRLAYFVEEGYTFQDTFFELGAHIDLLGATFRGIGSSSKWFGGKLDAKGYSISNFTITAAGKADSGLFRYIDGNSNSNSAYVRNLIVRNATVSGQTHVGIIAGYARRGDITGCTVENCTVTSSSNSDNCVGGIAGYTNYADVTDCVVKGCSVTGSSSSKAYVGGAVGYFYVLYLTGSTVDGCTVSGEGTKETIISPLTGFIDHSAAKNCFVVNTVSGGTGTVYGAYETYYTNPAVDNHYRNLTLSGDAPISDIYCIDAGASVTVSGTPTISYDGVDYYAAGATATIGYSGEVPGGSTLAYCVLADGTDITATALDGTTLTVPESDVTVIAGIDTFFLAANAATVLGEDKYVTTFYHGTLDYRLPEGALAYTAGLVNGEVVFYRIGENSDVIPHGTAVIVVADAASVSLTVLDSDPGVTPHTGNILQGSDTETDTPAGNVYVLGATGEPSVLGFYKYTGATIPAGKAYYVAE